ncbi:hypothetical protein K0U83_26635, partial [bacterium]|nr:hypothetical protein [bacterium]
YRRPLVLAGTYFADHRFYEAGERTVDVDSFRPHAIITLANLLAAISAVAESQLTQLAKSVVSSSRSPQSC